MLQLQWHFSSDESTYMTRLACFEEMPARLRRLTPEPSWPVRRVASALLTQLATLGYDYSGDATRQGNTTSLTVFSTTLWQDEMTPHCWHRTRHHLLLITINTLDAVIWFQPPHGQQFTPKTWQNISSLANSCPVFTYNWQLHVVITH
jgi:hypothetical protein